MGGKTFAELCHSHKDTLEEAMRNNEGPDPKLLAGYEWDGWTNLKIPWSKFRKGFLEINGKVIGYNSRMQSNEFNDSWLYMPGKEPFGFFEVYPAKDDPKANIYPDSTLITYRTRKNDLVTEATKDYVVELASPKDQTILLGKMHLLLDDLVNDTLGNLLHKIGNFKTGTVKTEELCEKYLGALKDLKGHQFINGCKHIPIPPNNPYFFLRKAEKISSAKKEEIKRYLK